MPSCHEGRRRPARLHVVFDNGPSMSRTANNTKLQPKASVLEGAPPWITAELLADTLETWQPFYAESLTETDALEILLQVGQLVDVVGESDE